MMQNKRKALIVIAAAVGINLIGGLVYCWSIISKELILNYDWTNTQASLPFMTGTMTIAFFMVVGGRIRDKFSPRISALIGGALAGSGLFLSGFFTTPLPLMITYGFITGAGFGFTGSATTVTAMKWFPAERRGMVSGICMAGIAFASVYVSPIINRLIEFYDIHKTFHSIGVAAFAIIIALGLLLKDPPETSPVVSGASESDWRSIFRKAGFYRLWSIYLLGGSVGLAIISNIAVIALKQAQWQDGFLLVMMLAIFNGTGRFASGVILDKIGVRKTFGIVLLMQIANMICFNSYKTTAILSLGTALAGFCYGGMIAAMPAATAVEFGTKNLGVNWGLVNSAFGFCGILGPVMAGRIVDITGSYQYVYLCCAALLIAATIVASTLKK